MATTKRVKKNIKEDHLVTMAVRFSSWAQEHFNQVIIGVVVLVAVIAVVVFTANSRQNAAREGEQQMSSALALFTSGDFQSAKASFQQITDRFGGSNAITARFFKAECELNQRNYTAAIADFDLYLASEGDDVSFRESAMFGKALCYEGLENYSEGATTLVALMSVLHPDDPRYLDTAYQAGEFFARAGDPGQAAKYFREVSEKASGSLKEKATVAAALLE